MIRRIFLDLDDVCNTLGMHVLHEVGCKVSSDDYNEYPIQLGYGVHLAANYLLGYARYETPAAFWSIIDRKVWAECPTSEIFPWILLRAARLVGRENVCIATSPTKCPESLAGKLDWIHRVMPSWMHRQYAVTPRKHLFARPDSLLIDDTEANLDRFQEEGGQGILVPRPWNKRWGQDPFEAVDEQLANLF